MKLPVMEKYFDGYDVPERYKNIASCIIRRFDISGSADGMYICNVIAHCSDCGDGCGKFTGDDVNIEKSASFLKSAYGCNIMDFELPELKSILLTGEINAREAVPALRLYIHRMRKEKPLESGGKYTKRYIMRCIHNAADAIDEISRTLPNGYTPDYYEPGMYRE